MKLTEIDFKMLPTRSPSSIKWKNEKYHLYHLLQPSILPFLTAFFAFLMLSNIVFYWHYGPACCHFQAATFQIVVFGFLVVLFSWFCSVVLESIKDHTKLVSNGLRFGFILFILSEILFFFAFFWGYFHYSLTSTLYLGYSWPPSGTQEIDIYGLPLINTLLLLSSGVTITIAHHLILVTQVSKYNVYQFNQYLFLTIIFGIAFLVCQGIEYIYGLNFRWDDNIFGSCFFILTGFHGFHVTVGTIFLLFCFVRTQKAIWYALSYFIKRFNLLWSKYLFAIYIYWINPILIVLEYSLGYIWRWFLYRLLCVVIFEGIYLFVYIADYVYTRIIPFFMKILVLINVCLVSFLTQTRGWFWEGFIQTIHLSIFEFYWLYFRKNYKFKTIFARNMYCLFGNYRYIFRFLTFLFIGFCRFCLSCCNFFLNTFFYTLFVYTNKVDFKIIFIEFFAFLRPIPHCISSVRNFDLVVNMLKWELTPGCPVELTKQIQLERNFGQMFWTIEKSSFTSNQHVGFETAAWYWHFVDIVWLFLFVSVYYWGTQINCRNINFMDFIDATGSFV